MIADKKPWSVPDYCPQVEAGQVLGISQSRLSDLIRGKLEKFSLGMLITLATRVGKKGRTEVRGVILTINSNVS